MLADVVQTFSVVLIVVAAAGYLMLMLRRSWRQGGGCGCCGPKKLPFSGNSCAPQSSANAGNNDRVPSKQVISSDRLVDSARDIASEPRNESTNPPGQVS